MGRNDDRKKLVDAILAHHGVKGMKWGIRRRSSGGSGVRTKIGSGLHPHADAVAARAAESKLKKGGHNALSNEELQRLALRLNLEQQVSRLRSKSESPAKAFIAKTLKNVAQQQVQNLVNDAATKQVKSMLDK